MKIAPILFADVKVHSVNLIVRDNEPKSTTYPLSITVTNSAPTLATNPVD